MSSQVTLSPQKNWNVLALWYKKILSKQAASNRKAFYLPTKMDIWKQDSRLNYRNSASFPTGYQQPTVVIHN